jgi:hypothetical protein
MMAYYNTAKNMLSAGTSLIQLRVTGVVEISLPLRTNFSVLIDAHVWFEKVCTSDILAVRKWRAICSSRPLHAVASFLATLKMSIDNFTLWGKDLPCRVEESQHLIAECYAKGDQRDCQTDRNCG